MGIKYNIPEPILMKGTKVDLDELVESRSKIRIDIGCGANKRSGWIGMDVRDLEGVDVVHNILDFPWPFPDHFAIPGQRVALVGYSTRTVSAAYLRERPGMTEIDTAMLHSCSHRGRAHTTYVHLDNTELSPSSG